MRLNTGAVKRQKFGRKQIRQFRQGRVNARKYLAQENRMRSARSRRLQKKLETAFRRDLRIIVSEVKAGVRPAFGQSARRKENEIRAAVTAETKKLFNDIVENNDRKYKPVFTKAAVDLGFGFDRSFAVDQWSDVYFSAREPILANISQSMTTKIFNDINTLQEEGLGIDPIAREITRKYNNISRKRAALIARTEVHNASGFGQHNYHRELSTDLGINMTKQWVATLDARTRNSHAAMNGVQVKMEESFKMPNGTEMQYVGDPSGGAANIINCRCAIVYVDADDEVSDSKVGEPLAESTSDDFDPIETDEFGRPQNNLTQAEFMKKFGGLGIIEQRGKADAAVSRLNQKLAATEETYGVIKNVARYQGRNAKNFYKIDKVTKVTSYEEPLLPIAFERVVDELNVLTDKFKVPRLRGFTGINRGRSLANMGDGVMGINSKFIGDLETNFRYKQSTSSLQTAKWKRGDDINDRPWSVRYNESDQLERFRSTLYHELGHHIHQTWGYNFKGETRSGYFLPKIERIMQGKRLKGTGPSQYSDTNAKEWFAENFSAWARGRSDLAAPRFNKFIEKLAKGVDVDDI